MLAKILTDKKKIKKLKVCPCIILYLRSQIKIILYSTTKVIYFDLPSLFKS